MVSDLVSSRYYINQKYVTLNIKSGCFEDQKICTCADPFSLACPLHIQDSDSVVRDGLTKMTKMQRENSEENRVIKSETAKETRIPFQGPFCDCQVRVGVL